MKRLLLVPVLLGACGGTPAPIANRPTAKAETLGEQLERDVGRGLSVAIIGGKAGLRAISADGARQQMLTSDDALWVLVDNRSHVVWYSDWKDPSNVRALDLDAPAPVERTVVTAMPRSGAGDPLFGVRYGADDLDTGGPMTPRVLITLDKVPAIASSGGILDQWNESEAFAADVAAKAKLHETAWLAQVAARGAGGAFSLGAKPKSKSKSESRVAGVDPSGCDGDPSRCGHAEAVAPTKLWRVVVSYTCGDGCHAGWKLYEPATRRFVDVTWTGQVDDAWVSRDGTAFVQHGVVIRFDRGPLAETPEAQSMGGGWLGGGYYYP